MTSEGGALIECDGEGVGLVTKRAAIEGHIPPGVEVCLPLQSSSLTSLLLAFEWPEFVSTG